VLQKINGKLFHLSNVEIIRQKTLFCNWQKHFKMFGATVSFV